MILARIYVTPGPLGNFHARLQYSELVAQAATEQAAADKIVLRNYGPDKAAVSESYDELTRKRTYRIEDKNPAGLLHLSQVLKAVATYNSSLNRACSVDILVPLVRAPYADVYASVNHAERTGLIQDAGGRRFWITAAGGDHMDAERERPVPLDALAVHSDGDLN